MQTTCGNAMKNARNQKNMQIKKAAYEMNVSERKLYMCEADEMKNRDGQLFLDAMKLYKNIEVGLQYLSEDPVFQYLFGSISITDPLTAAARYATENDGGSQTASVLLWGLSGGNEPLLEIIVRKIKNYMDSSINLYLNITQRQGFA